MGGDDFSLQIVLFPILVVAIGWFLVVVSFGVGTYTSDLEQRIPRGDSTSYPYWMVSFSGPLLLVSAVIHAALQRPYSSVFGAIVSSSLAIINL